MARLEVSAIPGAGLKRYDLNIHGHHPRDGDVVEIAGRTCGDRSLQLVRCKLEGAQGAALTLRFRCLHEGMGHVVLNRTISIPPAEDVLWFKL